MRVNVLLTGGAGYIGSHTAVELLEAGHTVLIADNFSNSSIEAVRRVEEIAGKPVKLYRADVANKSELEPIFAENTVDAVIHFAGYKSVGESVAKPLEYYRNNLDTVLTVLETMAKYGCKRIVFSSSATVYGEAEEMPVTEKAPKRPCTNPYGWTKSMIEQILMDASHADKELEVTILRYFNPVGAHESGKIGEDPNGIPNNLMPYITQVAVGKLPQLYVFGNDYPTPDGTGVRDYIHVVDLAKGHLAALLHSHAGAEIYNLGTGTGYSVLDMVKAFEEANGIRIPYVVAPRREGDIAVNYSDPAKAERLLGWRAGKTLSDMVRDAWNWQKNNPAGYQK